MNMKKNWKIIIVILAIIVILSIGLIMYKYIKDRVKDNINGENKVVETEKLLGKYVNILSGNYYIRYSGKFKNLSGDEQQATVEVSKKDKSIAMNSSELGIGFIDNGEVSYSISHRSKTVIKISNSNQLEKDVDDYIFIKNVENFENEYLGSGEEKIDGVKYEYEDYKESENAILRYYFLRGELKYIKLSKNDNETIVQVIDINNKSKENLFKVPSGYKNLSV